MKLNYKSKMSLTEHILNRIQKRKKETGQNSTLLAVCPNSIATIKASLRSAKRNNSPIKFAATLNQVDNDRGYTGFNQKEFVKFVEFESSRIDYTGPVIFAIDHGGPWLKDVQSKGKWTLQEAMNGIKKSFESALLAGYDLIHVDPTVDIESNNPIEIETVVQRTLELIQHTENFRKKHNLPKISYEVGTEEVHGGLADDDVFDKFLFLLESGLRELDMLDAWPCFIVGKVGTDLHTTDFDPFVATKLTEKVRKYGSYIKGHYTDGVTNPEDYPKNGMGAANVGPEFTISEYNALLELEKLEQNLFNNNRLAIISNISAVLKKAVIESNRWQKWLQPNEVDLDFDEINNERKNWLIGTCCRYIWQNPEVVVSRAQLYSNLKDNGVDGEFVVLNNIEKDMDKYFRAFNLIHLNNYLYEE